MKFQADAHVSVEIVEMLRRLGHDVLDAGTIPPRKPDVDILKDAAADDRVVVTADKGFGDLIFLHAIAAPGVVLVRLPMADERDRVAHLDKHWPTVMSRLPGHFVTVTAFGVRARRIP